MLNWTTLTLAQVDTSESLPPSLPPSSNQAQTPGTPADPTVPGTPNPGPQPASPPPGGGLMQLLLPALLAAMVLMFIFSSRKQKKQAAERKSMIDAIKKGDKVQTIGGIRGTVAEVHDEEIVVKVDENSNTRMRFVRNAVSTVIDSKVKDD